MRVVYHSSVLLKHVKLSNDNPRGLLTSYFLAFKCKFLEIQFSQNSQPDGGKIYTFLLEKVSLFTLLSKITCFCLGFPV